MTHRYEGLDVDQIVIQEDAFSNLQPTSTNKKHKVNSNSKWKNKLILVIVLCICYLVYQSWITYMKYQKRHRKDNLKEKQQKSIQNEILMNDSTILDKQNREKDIIKSQLKQPWQYISEVKKNMKQHQLLSDSLRQYYDSLQQKVQIIKVSYQYQSNKSEQNGLTIIINAIHNYTLDDNFVVNFLESVKSMFNSYYREDSHIKQVQIIWILCVSNNSKIKDMFYNTFDSYKLNNRIKYTGNVESIDSTYEFITKYIQTPNIVYAHSSVKFDQPTITSMRQKIVILNEKEENTVNIYCPSQYQFKWEAGRYDQSEQNINKCMYSYRSMYLKMITPTNFAFQTAYTMNQVLIIPVLTLGHMANTIVSHSSTVQKLQDKSSTISSKYFDHVQFVLAQHQQQISFPPTMCFVGFPTLSHSNNYSQIIRYLDSFQNIKNQTSNNYVIILSIVYNHEQPTKLLELLYYIKQLQSKNISFKIKIRDNIVYGPLEVYEAAWSYCPKNSIIISSRFNVNPNLPAIKKSIQQYQLCSSSKWALFGNYQYKQTVSNLQDKIKVEKHQKRRQYDELFHTHLATGQIFCSHLWRTLQVYAVKWQQTEFYQTQYSFAIPLLQKSVSNYAFTADSLFTKHQNLILTKLESQQIDGLRLRKNYLDIPQQKTKSILFNSLINCGLKRNPKQLIPRIMHQIWLSYEQNMSPFKQTLMNTLMTTNPQFTHKLWTIKDISRQNFPYTYDGIQKYIKLSKENKKNFRALIADLMRIEILYWYGGIYFDMKVEGRKSLIDFLKYEQFFYYSSPESLVNGIIGSIPGNSHFRKILQEYYIPQKLNLPFQHIYDQTGGPVIAKAYNQKQIAIQVLNFIQFIGQGQRPCIYQNFNEEPDQNQKVFEGKTAKGKSYRVFIPCKKNLDKYLQLYNVLGRTYFDNAPKYWL